MENGLGFVLGNALENYTDIPPEEKRDRKKQTVLQQVMVSYNFRTIS